VVHRVTLIPGDGIGPELTEATRRVLEATGVAFQWDVAHAGADVMAEHGGNPLPEATLESVRRNGVALKGPITTPIGEGFRSVNVGLRTALDLYAQVRPCKTYRGVRTRFENVDLVIVRETTEDIYAGIEFEQGADETAALAGWLEQHGRKLPQPDSGISIKPISITGTRRVFDFAFDYARRMGRRKVTAVHKANIMKFTDGLWLRVAREVAAENADLEFDDRIADNMCMQLVQHPDDYDVLVLPNLYGDIVSDLAAVEVRQHEDVVVVRVLDELHAHVVRDPVVELEVGVLRGDLARDAQPEPVRELHDVRLVDRRHLATAHPARVVEREVEHATRPGDRDRLDRDPRVRLRQLPPVLLEPPGERGRLVRPLLELDPGVDVLGRLAHDHEVDVLEAGSDAAVGLARAHLRVEVERRPQADVDRAEPLADRGRDRALQRDPVPTDGLERRLRQRVAAVLGHHVRPGVGDVPLERDPGRLEHPPRRLRQLRADPVAGDERDAVDHAPILRSGGRWTRWGTVSAMDEIRPGLEGVVAFETEIAEPDKEGGALRYRGVDVEELVGRYPFEQVWGLLVDESFEPGMPHAERIELQDPSGSVMADLQAGLATLGPKWQLRKLVDLDPAEARDDLA